MVQVAGFTTAQRLYMGNRESDREHIQVRAPLKTAPRGVATPNHPGTRPNPWSMLAADSLVQEVLVHHSTDVQQWVAHAEECILAARRREQTESVLLRLRFNTQTHANGVQRGPAGFHGPTLLNTYRNYDISLTFGETHRPNSPLGIMGQ